MIYFCCDHLRRKAVQGSALNGIDFLEVLDHEAPTEAERQRTLFVHFVNPLVSALPPANLRIDGGERIRDVVVTSTNLDASDPCVLVVQVNHPGDFSCYTLRLVQDPLHTQPPAGFDPPLALVEFSFKVECPTDFDCQVARFCPPELQPSAEINYLAKDYASFRRLMLDRMALLMPQWSERNPADLGITLVELLAYIGDHLSYQQDAVATEAYLGTARRRVSVRRHALLVDYFMHDGCNARVWVQVEVEGGVVLLPRSMPILTRILGQPQRIPPPVDFSAYLQTLAPRPEVFETMLPATLFPVHNQMFFYTWSDERCCLPKGAIRATLCDNPDPALRLRLCSGDVLIFQERLGPETGLEEDADRTHRHAVRLVRVHPEATRVMLNEEEVDRTPGPLFTDQVTGQAIVEIEWAEEDALSFPLCISSVIGAQHGHQYQENVSVALGNIVAADHGWTLKNEFLGMVPKPKLFKPPVQGSDRCLERQVKPVPPRFRPQLQERPLTHAAPHDPAASAATTMRWSMRTVLPAVTLKSELGTDAAQWEPQRDLLQSGPGDTAFVVEVESDATAFLRFGDDRHGSRPDSGTIFHATYRVGNGVAGNIGAEAIAHIVSSDSAIVAVHNPLPARGGVEPESMRDVRQRAPYAFRTQERAVTPEDYAAVSERHAQVQRAAATFRWTGSWHTVFVTADRRGGLAVDDAFETELQRHVERYRMAGYDLEIDGPRFVPLEIEMHVCVKPGYFRSHVKAALLRLFSNLPQSDGQRGVFHPDNFTFGQPVYLSRLYAVAQAVPGVDSVLIPIFQRQGTPDRQALDDGKLTLGRLEIARLDNDPNFPGRGVFRLNLEGGK
jgi:hypothetical protein